MTPTSPAGKWKRRKADVLQEITGRAWCMSCRQSHPAANVKRYKGMQRGVVMRCDVCQARRTPPVKVAA